MMSFLSIDSLLTVNSLGLQPLVRTVLNSRTRLQILANISGIIALTILGLDSPTKAADLDFLTGWETIGDVQIESSTEVNLSTDGFSEDDFDLGAESGAFNFSLNPAALVGFGGLEDFLGIDVSSLDVGGVAFEGSGIKTSLTLTERTQLSFDWNFLTNETSDTLREGTSPRGPFNDYGFVLIGQQVNKLADHQNTTQGSCALGFDACTGVQKKTYILNRGTYTLAFGVIDIDDFVITSGLSLSNFTLTALPGSEEPRDPPTVPEPNLVFALLSFGAMGRLLCRR